MICVVDYGMGNLRSVAKALEKLGARVVVSSEAREIETAEKVVLPGVGAFGDACRELHDRGLFGPIREHLAKGKPFLGICLGMQLLFDESEESRGVPGLGIFTGTCLRFQRKGLKVPHMGWNEVKKTPRPSPLLENVRDKSFFYFVHSFYPLPRDQGVVAGVSDYGGEEFAAVVGREKIWATQFHPEKSQDAGLEVLRNFIRL